MTLPKHYSRCDIVKPFEAPYYANQFGTKSIGEPDWRPHISNALSHPHCQQHSIKGGDGLDKFSQIRCPELVSTVEENRRATFKAEQRPSSPPHKENCQEKEPSQRVRKYEERSAKVTRSCEHTIEDEMCRRRKVSDIRNGIGQGADGDKTYYIPEYSRNFHRQGSTLPIANFGGSSRSIADTFIPLVKLPLSPRTPFREIERKKEKVTEIDEVKQLDFWKPAKELKH